MRTDAASENRSTRAGLAAQTLVSLGLSLALATPYLDSVKLELLSPLARAWSFVAYAAHFAELHAFALTGLLLLSLVVRSRRILLATGAALFSLAHLLLYVDERLFAFFRFHLNPYVLHFALEPSALAQTGVPSSAWFALVAVLAVAFAAFFGFGRFVAGRDVSLPRGPRLAAGLLPLVLLVLADKAGCAWFSFVELEGPTDVTLALPLYMKSGARNLLTKLAVKPREKQFSASPPLGTALPESAHAVYPPEGLAAVKPTAKRRPNVVVLAVESFRADAIDPETAPRLSAFAKQTLEGRRHISGGNCTHLGLFSLLYSASAFNWEVARQAKAGPVPVELFRRLGYTVRWANSVALDFFDIDRFMFDPREQLARYDVKDWAAADRRMNDDLEGFLREKHDAPFLLWGFYVSTHHNYLYPPEHERFTPVIAPTFSPNDLSLKARRPELWNRYRNSVHYVDAMIGEVLDTLEQTGHADDTVVLVTGDHGESFFEDGRFTHASAFTEPQVHVPMLLKLPGVAARTLEGVTRHVDLLPTVLDFMGVDVPPERYGDGRSFLSGEAGSALVGGCYFTTPVDYAVVDAEGFEPFHMTGGRLTVDAAQGRLGEPRRVDAGGAAKLQLELVKALKDMQRFTR